MTPGEWQAVRHLFNACLDTSPESRAKVLAEADVPESVRTETARLLNNLDGAGDSFLQAPAGIQEVFRREVLREAQRLAVGERLGPYEIVALIGAGGMGEVYKANDTRLDRIVAIKTSKLQFTERFEREARAVAALNHPNICQLYDVGSDYIVLEYVDGSPVAPTDSIRKLLDIAVQLADGMAAAHAAGFAHRDLKPSNVLVTPQGRVKILDFGLVKTVAKADDASTLSFALTANGMVAGTAAYMSPEQASGSGNLDARSDQFSCGLMLYEMASGKRAFKRPTAAETLTAIIREDPEPLPASIPAPLRWIIHRCLSKEPRDRYESSRDLYLELRGLRENLSDASSSTAIPALTAQPKRRLWGALLVFAAGVALTAGIGLVLRPAPAPRGALRFTPFSFEQGGQNSPVWSPDGKAVAFAARQKVSEPFQVYVRYLDSPVPRQITHIAEAAFPLQWTSSGQIVFRSQQRKPPGLWSVSPVGGEPEPLLEDKGGFVASVARDGSTAAIYHQGEDGLFSLWISAPPGEPLKPYQPAPFASRNVVNNPDLKFSPDGKQILLARNAGAREEVWLMPYPANAARPPHRILEGLPARAGTPEFSWMRDNRRVVISTLSAPGAAAQLYMADTVSGQFDVLSSGTTAQVSPAVSPDGTKLILMEASQNSDIVSMDLATLSVTPLIATQRNEEMPAWASKEPALVYVTDRSGDPEIWLHTPGQPDRPLVTASDFPRETTKWFIAPSLSPDASRLIYTHVEQSGPTRLWMSAAVPGGAPVRVVKKDTDIEFVGSWSPDGNWFTYWEVKDGKTSLNKVKTTGQAEPEVLKADVKQQGNWGWVPLWSPSDDWILYSDAGVVKLISPDGKTRRDLASKDGVAFAFSADGKTLYGLRQVAFDRDELFSVSVAGGAEKTIGFLGREYFPASPVRPSLRLSLAPDGKSVTYSTLKASSNLWLVDGLSSVK